jgi:hypothetical protein
MRISHVIVLSLLIAVLLLGGLSLWARRARGPSAPYLPPFALPGRPLPTISYEAWARREFERRHPGEKPLNWRIAAKAVEFRRTRPMGRFVLDRNDCSDFVDAILDDALGAQARFRRHSAVHLLAGRRIWDFFYWDRRTPLQPGDELCVRHSPWYEPYESRLWHVGIIGSDGMVYDWTKLVTWPEARYGRNSVEWFVRHCPDPKEVVVVRLAPQYRYAIEPLPLP